MFQEITYYLILGIPFIVYLGVLVFVLFGITALIALLRRKGIIKLNVQWHYLFAYLALTAGIIHGILGIIAYI
jgi:hypothetical protein